MNMTVDEFVKTKVLPQYQDIVAMLRDKVSILCFLVVWL
jgi:hypothetical protein